MGYLPNKINGQSLDSFIDSIELCYATKGTSYYNKISGGVRCSNLELLKLDLIVYLLNRYEKAGGSLDCIYSGQTMTGIIYSNPITTPADTTTHLQVYVDHVSRFCKDCIISDAPAAVVPPAATNYLYGEDGITEITLETGGHINL